MVVEADGTILATGYNGFPRGVVDDPGRYLDREVKLKLIVHAEANCVAQAARTGARLLGACRATFDGSRVVRLVVQGRRIV